MLPQILYLQEDSPFTPAGVLEPGVPLSFASWPLAGRRMAVWGSHSSGRAHSLLLGPRLSCFLVGGAGEALVDGSLQVSSGEGWSPTASAQRLCRPQPEALGLHAPLGQFSLGLASVQVVSGPKRPPPTLRADKAGTCALPHRSAQVRCCSHSALAGRTHR